MTAAIKVVDTALREDFGFEHILWVFSGRRGVHCWVCDRRARRLTNEQRSAIAEYFRVYKGTEANGSKVSFSGAALHPSLMRAYDQVLRGTFESEVLPNQELLSQTETWKRVLNQLPDQELQDRMDATWRSDSRRASAAADVNLYRWQQLEAATRAAAKKNASLRKAVEEIVFAFTYPRLDLEVSKHMNHLLKAPFCVHPKTGAVCVPIDPANCGIESTSLAPFMEIFQSTFLRPLLSASKEELEAEHKQKLHSGANSRTVDW
ncbi:unnamed protein product [Closterium sp. Naga37s-1]|nr:unnamed protein product [Closterium sp. Naga37s-1]